MKLTDEELEDEIRNLLDNRHRPLAYDNSDGLAVLTELRQLRALLATPMSSDCIDVHLCDDATEPDVWIIDSHYSVDEAAMIGAACLRAALAAKGQGE